MKKETKISLNSKNYQEYLDIYKELHSKSKEEIQILYDLYFLQKESLLRNNTLFVKVPFFFTTALALFSIFGADTASLLNGIMLLLFWFTITFLTIRDLTTIAKKNSQLHKYDLYLIVCKHILNDELMHLKN